jgi:hypothetical protein
MIKNKIVSTRLLLSIGFMMSVQLSHAVKLSIDNSTPINLSADVNYVIADQVIEFSSSDPVICRKLNGTVGALNAEIIDPNGDGQVMPLLQSVRYNVTSQTTKASINNPSGVCVTKNNSTFNDILFRNAFEPVVPTFTYQGLSDLVVRGQSLDYQISIENPSNQALMFDLVEYVSTNSITNSAYFESLDLWECLSHNVAGVDCNEDNTGNRLLNAAIPAGQTALIDVSRTVGSSSVLGQSIEILTAMFIKNGQGEIIGTEVISFQPTVVNNNAPVLVWGNSNAIDFIEDEGQSHTLNFDVFDSTGVDVSPGYLATAIGAVNDKLDIDGINVVENEPGEYTVFFDVTPKANQFTSAGNTEQIFVQIEDEFNAPSNLLILAVNIEPINDAPSFTPTCLDFTINPTPVGGQAEITCNLANGVNRATWVYSDFISSISAGGIGNDTEANQAVIFEVDPVSGIANNGTIIIDDGGGFIKDDLVLMLDNGISGSGSFRIRAIDNGVSDVCPAVAVGDNCNTSAYSQEIMFNLLAPVYFVSGTIDDLPDGDELGVRLFEAGTNNPLGGNLLVAGAGINGGQAIDFSFPQALSNGVSYDVQITISPLNRTCVITDGATGTINDMNVNDLVIDCEPNPN